MRQPCRDNRFAFGLSFEDGLEIVLLGDGDHLSGLYDDELIVVNAEEQVRDGRVLDPAAGQLRTGADHATQKGTVRSPRDCPSKPSRLEGQLDDPTVLWRCCKRIAE